MADPNLDADGYDPQDQAEAFDETHSTDELGYPDETRSFEPDLFENTYDVTSAQGDADEDDIALDADEYDPDELEEEDDDGEEGEALYLDDDLDDEDDDLEDGGLTREPSAARASANEAELEFTDNLDDAGRSSDRLSRRYESAGELSQADVRSLGYGQDTQTKETTMGDDDKAKGSGASAEDVEDESHPRQEELLDEGVEETFPASDPVSVKHIT